MDNLTACAIAARRAGMSYGQYMATNPQPVPIARPKREPARLEGAEVPEYRTCKNCGKEFPTINRAHNAKYCSPMCVNEALTRRAKERSRAKKKISNDDILICPRCGKSFIRGNRHAGVKYCSEECTAKRAQKTTKEGGRS